MNKLVFKKRVPEPKEMEKLEFDVFEDLSRENYSRWFVPFVDALLKYGLPADAKILDVACGPGLLSKSLVETGKKFTIVGVDISDYALKLAKKNCSSLKSVSFKKGSVEKLPFKDGVFDVVVCKDSFHHFNDPSLAIREMTRVLKNGGVLYMQDLRRDIPMYLFEKTNPPDTPLKMLQFYSVRASYTKEEMRNVLKKAGLRANVRTRKTTKELKTRYAKKFDIDPKGLIAAYQSRYYAIARK